MILISIKGRSPEQMIQSSVLIPAKTREKKIDGREKTPKDDRDFNELYQEYIGSIVNPQLNPPLPATLGYALWNPQSNKPVVFDHCQLTTGIMVDAKGHYEDVLTRLSKYEFFRDDFRKKTLRQAQAQIDAADANGGRPIEWYFYEETTMEYVRGILEPKGLIPRIQLIHADYPGNAEWPYPKEARRTWAKGRQKS